MNDELALLNANIENKTTDDFYIEFTDYDGNDKNILGQNAKSVTRPSIRFNEQYTQHKGVKLSNPANVELEPITVEFSDDGGSITSGLLYKQILSQRHLNKGFKFQILIKIYFNDKCIEMYTLKNAYLASVDHSQAMVENPAPNTISAIFNYDDIEVWNANIGVC